MSNYQKPTYGVAMSDENIKAERYRPIRDAFDEWYREDSCWMIGDRVDEHDSCIGFLAGWNAAMKYMDEKNGR